jgi:hypothetical protein
MVWRSSDPPPPPATAVQPLRLYTIPVDFLLGVEGAETVTSRICNNPFRGNVASGTGHDPGTGLEQSSTGAKH